LSYFTVLYHIFYLYHNAVMFWLQVSICFRKVAADVLGIRLMRQELDLQQPVFKAEINTYTDVASAAAAKTSVQTSRNKSSMCLIS